MFTVYAFAIVIQASQQGIDTCITIVSNTLPPEHTASTAIQLLQKVATKKKVQRFSLEILSVTCSSASKAVDAYYASTSADKMLCVT